MSSLDLFVAVDSVSPKPAGSNQDRVRTIRSGAAGGARGFVICDGVGSYDGSGPVAETYAQLVSEHLGSTGVARGFASLPSAIKSCSLTPAVADGATTLLSSVADDTGMAGFALIGNGTIVEAVADRVAGSTHVKWIELAHPHIDWSAGKPALASFLPCEPENLDVSIGWKWSPAIEPRLFLACSDGIATPEEQAIASLEGDPRRWRELPAGIAQLADDFSQDWDEIALSPADEVEPRIASIIGDFLESKLAADEFSDDATLGVLYLRPAQSAAKDRP